MPLTSKDVYSPVLGSRGRWFESRSAWKALPTPSPEGNGWLAGVAITSARSAWAVGSGATGTLIVR
jgi:hypothetical protein